jgi:hypothetical protein
VRYRGERERGSGCFVRCAYSTYPAAAELRRVEKRKKTRLYALDPWRLRLFLRVRGDDCFLLPYSIFFQIQHGNQDAEHCHDDAKKPSNESTRTEQLQWR